MKRPKCSRSAGPWDGSPAPARALRCKDLPSHRRLREESEQPTRAGGKQTTHPGAGCCFRLGESVYRCIPLYISARERTKIITQSINKIWSPFGNNQRSQCDRSWHEHRRRVAEQNFRAWGVDPRIQNESLKTDSLTILGVLRAFIACGKWLWR